HENTVQFFVAPYHGELVIDPALQWTTYYGGTEDERLREVAVDGNNFVYAAGTTSSSTNIATTGAFQTTFRILRTPTMLVKFNEQGQRLWGTYYGEGSEYHHEAKANRRIAF